MHHGRAATAPPPYHIDKQQIRMGVEDRVAERACRFCVKHGGWARAGFDGASFALDNDGALAYRLPSFEYGSMCSSGSAGRWRAAQTGTAQ